MSVINKRNAVLGWVVWEVGKRSAKKRARRAVPGPDGSRAANVGAIAGGLAAAGGALWVWRRHRADETPTTT